MNGACWGGAAVHGTAMVHRSIRKALIPKGG
jgi:hypothetical protein